MDAREAAAPDSGPLAAAGADRSRGADACVGAAPTSPTPVTFEDLFRREYTAMVSIAAAMTGDRWIAEDIAQVAFSRAHADWPRVSTLDRPGAWLRRVTINLACDDRRRTSTARRTIAALTSERAGSSGRTGCADPASPTGFTDHDPELWRAVGRLPRNQRAAIVLHYLEDRPVHEISDVLGCSESTARVHLHRGRVALSRSLGKLR